MHMTLPDVDAQLGPRPMWRTVAAVTVLAAGAWWVALLLAKEAPTSVTLRVMLPPALAHASRLEAVASDDQDVLAQLNLARACTTAPCSAAWPGEKRNAAGDSGGGGGSPSSVQWTLTLRPGRYTLTLANDQGACQRQSIAISRTWTLDNPIRYVHAEHFTSCDTATRTPPGGLEATAAGALSR